MNEEGSTFLFKGLGTIVNHVQLLPFGKSTIFLRMRFFLPYRKNNMRKLLLHSFVKTRNRRFVTCLIQTFRYNDHFLHWYRCFSKIYLLKLKTIVRNRRFNEFFCTFSELYILINNPSWERSWRKISSHLDHLDSACRRYWDRDSDYTLNSEWTYTYVCLCIYLIRAVEFTFISVLRDNLPQKPNYPFVISRNFSSTTSTQRNKHKSKLSHIYRHSEMVIHWSNNTWHILRSSGWLDLAIFITELYISIIVFGVSKSSGHSHTVLFLVYYKIMRLESLLQYENKFLDRYPSQVYSPNVRTFLHSTIRRGWRTSIPLNPFDLISKKILFLLFLRWQC